nr:hypothetical protein [Candidatus Sigynarchaeota archaeon]
MNDELTRIANETVGFVWKKTQEYEHLPEEAMVNAFLQDDRWRTIVSAFLDCYQAEKQAIAFLEEYRESWARDHLKARENLNVADRLDIAPVREELEFSGIGFWERPDPPWRRLARLEWSVTALREYSKLLNDVRYEHEIKLLNELANPANEAKP